MGLPILFLEENSAHQENVEASVVLETANKFIQTLHCLRRINKKISLNSPNRLSRCELAPGYTLSNLYTGPKYREEWLFIKDFLTRSPLSDGCENWLKDLTGVEAQVINSKESKALACAVLLDTGTISFHVDQVWKSSWIKAKCITLDSTGNLLEETQKVPNSSIAEHVTEHESWLKFLGHSRLVSATELWEERKERFPNLRFLDRFKSHLESLETSGSPYKELLSALDDLNKDALAWSGEGKPSFSRKIAEGEHDKRRSLSVFHDDETHQDESFGYHAYFHIGKTSKTPGGRIHFRLSSDEKKFIIATAGYKQT